MGFLQRQTFTDGNIASVTDIDFTNITLHADTEKIVVIGAGNINDVAAAPDVSSMTWDQGGNNESLTFITGTRAQLNFAGDRYVATEIWRLDNPTLVSNATLRVVLPDAPNSGNYVIHIYEFDGEADSGASGDTGTHTSNNADPSITLSTRDANGLNIIGGVHQVSDSNPFTPGTGVTEDYDDDVGSAAHFAGHMDGTGGSDTIGYSQTTGRRNAASAYEVLITPAAAGAPESNRLLIGVGNLGS